MVKKKAPLVGEAFCALTGIRTPVLALKGLRPGPLDDEGKAVKILSPGYGLVKPEIPPCVIKPDSNM